MEGTEDTHERHSTTDEHEYSTSDTGRLEKLLKTLLGHFTKGLRSIPSMLPNRHDLIVLLCCISVIVIAKALVFYQTWIMVQEDMVLFTNYVEGVDPFLLALAHQWDANHLLNLAMNGYPTGVTDDISFAFAPLYPVMIALTKEVVGDYYIAGILISNAFYFLSLIAFYLVARRHMDRIPAYLSSTLFAVFPTYLVYGTVAYTESTALFFAIISWYFLEKEWYHLASVFLTLAMLTRYVFIMAFPVYGVIMLIRWNQKMREQDPPVFFFEKQLLWLAIPVVAVTALFLYFETLTGNFFVALTSHKFFGDSLMTPVDQFNWFFTGYFTEINNINPIGLVLEHYVFTIPFLVLTLSLFKEDRELCAYGIAMMWFTLSMVGISGIASPRIMLSSWVTLLAFGNDTPRHIYAVAISLCMVAGLWVMFAFLTSFFA